MSAFKLDQFQRKTCLMADSLLAVETPAEAIFMCVAAAATIVTMTGQASKDPQIIKMLQDTLAKVVHEQRHYQLLKGGNHETLH